MSKYTPAQAAAIKRYREKHKYIELRVRVSEESRDIIKEHSKAIDGSMNKFVNRAIAEAIERDRQELGLD